MTSLCEPTKTTKYVVFVDNFTSQEIKAGFFEVERARGCQTPRRGGVNRNMKIRQSVEFEQPNSSIHKYFFSAKYLRMRLFLKQSNIALARNKDDNT